jgi:hypothetical protein
MKNTRKKSIWLLLLGTIFMNGIVFGQNPNQDLDKDRALIMEAIDSYNEAWKIREANLAVQGYSSYIHWVNSIGDVIRTRKDLEDYLAYVFTLDFVMNSERIPQVDEITFLSENIGIVHSQHLEAGAKNFHLRVFYKEGDEWKIINHLTSKEHPKAE